MGRPDGNLLGRAAGLRTCTEFLHAGNVVWGDDTSDFYVEVSFVPG